jgi:hypothetical protein
MRKRKKNPHFGSSFESWLDEEGIRAEVTAAAVVMLTDDEQAAIAEALKGGFASDEEVAAFWKRVGIEPQASGQRRRAKARPKRT